MHINWRIPLGGSLQGVLPLPGLSAEAFIQAQVFGRKQVAQVALEDAQGIEVGQVFGGHAPVLRQVLPNDTEMINAGRLFRQQNISLDVRSGTGTTVTRDAQGFIVAVVAEDDQSILSVQSFARQPAAQQGMSPGWLMAFAASC